MGATPLEGSSMANGTAALQLVESAPASSGEPIDRRVGEAVADAVSAVAKALHEYGWTTAGLTPATKEAGAAQIAKLYKIFQASPNLDLIAARRECLRTIWARYGDD